MAEMMEVLWHEELRYPPGMLRVVQMSDLPLPIPNPLIGAIIHDPFGTWQVREAENGNVVLSYSHTMVQERRPVVQE